jgi:hypothetical protein
MNLGSCCVKLMTDLGFGESMIDPSYLVSMVQAGGCGVLLSNLQQLCDAIVSASNL